MSTTTSASEDYPSNDLEQTPLLPHGVSLLQPPVMNICIMIVGTRGDVQPFIGIAKRLQQDGHRVRLATHAVYRDFVMEHDVEFYPLGGDPKVLSAYMVRTGGQLAPLNPEVLLHDVPLNLRMINEICRSTWPAVSAADPNGGEPFRAHAIISNPVTYGHIHVAERLGVPLHIMFPQPSVPTAAFPHPLSPLSRSSRHDLLKMSRRNRWSYKAVYSLLWLGSEASVNRFRTDVLGLRKIRIGSHGRNLLIDLGIPHSYLWSPALLPKPTDWDELYDVVGTSTLHPTDAAPAHSYTPPPALAAFLVAGSDDRGDGSGGPIFVGFGSMVINDPRRTTLLIIEAAVRANVRVLIQSSWSDMAADRLTAPPSVFFLDECPHSWLLPRVSAVVHHGGAGTTAAGLLAGKPTFIVPFFSDQFLWGRAVATAGVGVEPCPMRKLTVERLAHAFEALQDPALLARARAMGEQMQKEDGASAAVAHFYRHLPLSVMRCEASAAREDDSIHNSEQSCHRAAMMWSPSRRQRLCEQCTLAMDSESDAIVALRVVDYSARGPDSILQGVCTGTGALVHEVAGGVKDVLMKPVRGFRDRGAVGATRGLASAVAGLVVRPVRGAVLLADSVAAGLCNARRAPHERKRDSVFLTAVEHKFCCLREA